MPEGFRSKSVHAEHSVPRKFSFRPETTTASAASSFGRIDTNKIYVEPLEKLPDFSVPMQLGRGEAFSLFIPSHSELASALIDIFIELPTREEFLSAAAYCRDRLNPYLFIYALSVALLHRSDTRDFRMPSMAQVFPDKYVSKSVYTRAKEEYNATKGLTEEPIIIPQDYTASDLDIEHRVAYFREDIGINIHHWHWHLVYPYNCRRTEIVDKDRRGELFYYMHHQILARYNFERLCNKLHRVKRLLNLREPIVEGYFPKLDNTVSSRMWPSRPSNTTLKDVHITSSRKKATHIHIDLDHVERLKDRLLHAVHTGRVETVDGKEILLTEKDGIDILGNIVEASNLSKNPILYGNFHNMGHLVIGFCHDPDNRHLEGYGVMGEETTAMRDPIFYRWHALVNDIFQEHKNALPPYSVDQLDYPGVKIQSVKISVVGQPENKLTTYWQQSDLKLPYGIGDTHRRCKQPFYVRFTHLQHDPFRYSITVENSGPARLGTVRIFLAPTNDERGVPFLFKDQRLLFIELDKYVCRLEPNSKTIFRSSRNSSVTIPFEQTFADLEAKLSSEKFNVCGCGWPDHMLIPRGSAKGFPCQLFVMVSNSDHDMVEKYDGCPATYKQCKEAASYCGIRNKKYPDKRAMGYPFDRQARSGVTTLKQFLTPNMAVQDVTITFTDRIKQRPQLYPA